MADNLQPTPEDLARDAAADMAVCEAATPGPWDDNGADHWGAIPVYTLATDVGYIMASSHFGQPEQARVDAAFIALARTAQPAWIRRAVAAEAEVARLKSLDVEEIVSAAVDAWVDSPARSDNRDTMRTVIARHIRAALDTAPTS